MPPNILFIMCDQLRHDWLGCAGAAYARTPNIDAIAARGMRFTQACTNAPICAPARIALATALRPHRMGALDNHAFLPHSRPTYYQRLRDHGYLVGCTGKLDLGKPLGQNGSEGRRPLTYSWGFTHPLECEGKLHAGRGDPPNGPYTHWLERENPEFYARFIADYRRRRAGGAAGVLAESAVPSGYCEDDFIATQACAALRAYTGEYPWHHFVSFVGPHDPYDPAPEYAARWQDAPMPEAIPCEPAGRPDRYRYPKAVSEQAALRSRRLYSAYLEQIDANIGRILRTLEETGQAERTCIVFASDHGDMLGDHGRWTKSCQYDSALRIPMIIALPGASPGVSDAQVELIDLAATICELAGAGPIPDTDAISLLPVVQGRASTARSCTISINRGAHAIRTPEWKLIVGEDGDHELYDLTADPQERRNIAAQQRPRTEELYARFITEGWIAGGYRR